MPSNRDASLGPAIYFVAAVGIAYLIVIVVQLPGGSRRGDFSIYYACAVAMHRGLDPYAINLADFTRQLALEPDPFAHPADTPTFTLVTEPLALMTPEHAYAMWFLANIICFAGSMYLLFGPSSKLNRKTAVLLSIGALGFTPLADNFRWAQSQVLALFGVLLFFRLLQRERDGTAGVLLAALGLLRGFPLVLGGYLIVRRRWRAIGFLAIAFILGAAATIARMGVVSVENFLRIIGVLGGHQWFSLEPRWGMAAANVSLDAFIARISPEHRGIVPAVKLAILALTFRATMSSGDDHDGRALSLWVATMLILTPVVWLHYLVLLMIPFGMLAVAAARREVAAQVWRSALLSYCLLVLATPLMSTLTFHADIFAWRAGAVAELGFLALLCAWFASYRFALEGAAGGTRQNTNTPS